MAEEREYGVAATFDFPLIVFGSTDADFSTGVAFDVSAGDIRLSKDGSTWVTINDTTPTLIGLNSGIYSLDLDSTEMSVARAVIIIQDQSGTKVWEDQAILITTYGSTLGLHAFNRNTTGVNVNSIDIAAITSTAIAAGAILSTGIAANAFIAEKFATDALTTASIAAGVFTKVWAESTRSITLLGAGSITSTAFAAGAINSTAIADATITAAKFAVGAISSGVVSTGQMELTAATIWDRLLTGALHNIATSAGRRLRQIEAAFNVHSGTAQGSTAANLITLDTGASSADDIYRGDRIVITEGDGAQEHGIITDYAGATRIATMAEDWIVSPTTSSIFELLPADVDVETWQHIHTTNEGDSSRPSVHVATMGAGVITSTAFAAGAINSTAIDDDAITAAKIASNALTTDEIADGVFTKIDAGTNTEMLDVLTVDTFGEPITTTDSPRPTYTSYPSGSIHLNCL